MKKLFTWISDNILFVIVLFLLFFIPLYPKKPLIDIVNTWVYVRAEDFVVFFSLIVWFILLVRKKVTLKTPLTMPILLFWIVGVLSTIHGILLIFPEISNAFPNVAFLSMLRRIEYISLFFIGFAAIRHKKNVVPYVVGALAVTLLAVSLYGFGQKYLGFPAYLTMNEEFAKGVPIQLSALSRVPSTFAGHYDLAAYLVLVIPILASMVFGLRNMFVKLLLLGTISAGFIVLFMTVSRVSFGVLLVSLAGVFFFHKKKWFLFSLPILGIFLTVLLVYLTPRLLDRFDSTVKEVDVLVDATTGQALGNIKEITTEDFDGQIVKKRIFRNSSDIDARSFTIEEEEGLASESSELNVRQLMSLPEEYVYIATKSGVVPYSVLPKRGVQLVPPNASTGESLPQGTGYVNLALSPVRHQFSEFFYQRQVEEGSATPSAMLMFTGDFLVKRASAYDLSLTTRYQGEWPNALEAFRRNIFFGSGYSSISLAIDNSYLRMLGEVGAFGFISFVIIFLTAGLYIRKSLQSVDSLVVRSFVIGFSAGVFGLILNATLIDVFEASKVAFYMWLLMGVTVGVLHLYQTKQFALYQELKKAASSTYAVLVFLVIVTLVMLFPLTGNFFVGDDFTWLRWAAEGKGFESIGQYFTQADGFFYRPGTKLYFLAMYSAFWLNPVMYHIVSLVLHVLVVGLVFILARKVLKDFWLSALAAFVFAMLSGYTEAVFWISSVGHLFSVFFVLLSILLFSLWDEKHKLVYFVASLLSIAAGLLFHELAVVAPLLIILYRFTTGESFVKHVKHMKVFYGLLFSPVILYLLVRFAAQSHWSGGDYSYNLLKLPFNVVGNFIGYFMLSFVGPLSLSISEALRNMLRENLLVSVVALLLLVGCVVIASSWMRKINNDDRKLYIFGVGFMFISLLPFLGLGNIASRYAYLASFGFVIIFAVIAKKLYNYLVSSGRDVATGVSVILLGIFFLLHIIQMQQIHDDWKEAGIKVNRFVVSIQGEYTDYWIKNQTKLTFVNVPIRSGEAWMFPVGLKDALWFTFPDAKLQIYQTNSLDGALNTIQNPLYEKVYEFDSGGSVVEAHKKLPLQRQ